MVLMNFTFGSRSHGYLSEMLNRKPSARAVIQGDAAHRAIHGDLVLYQLPAGVLVRAEVYGLPSGGGRCEEKIFGFHIHEGAACTGTREDPFANTRAHYNPYSCPHPSHAGDLPPLFGNNGYAWSAFLTNRFTVDQVIGRTVIVHSAPDDFTTQPSGNSGAKIACGVIRRA